MLESHIVLGLKANTGTEDVGQGTTLFGESIDDWSSRRSQRSLQHVAEDAQDTVEVLVILSCSAIGGGLPGDASHHLCKNDKIDDEWGCQK